MDILADIAKAYMKKNIAIDAQMCLKFWGVTEKRENLLLTPFLCHHDQNCN